MCARCWIRAWNISPNKPARSISCFFTVIPFSDTDDYARDAGSGYGTYHRVNLRGVFLAFLPLYRFSIPMTVRAMPDRVQHRAWNISPNDPCKLFPLPLYLSAFFGAASMAVPDRLTQKPLPSARYGTDGRGFLRDGDMNRGRLPAPAGRGCAAYTGGDYAITFCPYGS